MILRRATAHEVHPRNAGDAQEARLEVIARQLPQLGDLALRAGKADADDGEGIEREPPHRRLRVRRQAGLELRNAVEHVELAFDHVHLPVEKHVHLRAAAARGRAHLHHAGNVLHRLLDRPRDGGHHFVGGHDAAVNQDDAARKLRFREHRRRHPQRANRRRQGRPRG